GYSLTSVIGAIPAEIFAGRHYGTVFGTVMLAAIAGGAAGPWATGALYDVTGSYTPAFSIAIVGSVLSALAIWLAAPRKVRAVTGRRAPRGSPARALLPGHFHCGEALDHRHDDARVLLAEAGRERRLLVALSHVREADRNVQFLGDRVERVQALVHERHLEAGLEVARDQRLRDALERLA